MTAEEYEDCIWDLKLTLDDWWAQAGYRLRPRWLLSMDNDTAHKRARLDERCIWDRRMKYSLPPLSPDMHKVVEHVHAFLVQAMQAWRQTLWPHKPSEQQCKEKLVQLFYSYQPASIQADVDSLPDTYQAIIDNAGMYPPKEYR